MNNIELFKKHAPELLDTIYKAEAKTAVLDIDGALVKAGNNTNEIIIPKLDMTGLGDYDRNSGYTQGDINLTNETVKFNYERGKKLQADIIDDEETAGVIAGNLISEFERIKVIPEVDAVRFAQYSGTPGITNVNTAGVDYTDGKQVLKDLQKIYADMTNDEVPEGQRYLFIAPEVLSMAEFVARTENNDILKRFNAVIEVPRRRFYTAIELDANDGYKKAVAGKDLNFMVIEKSALLQFTKHQNIKVFTPEQDQDGDNHKFLYRIYGLNDVYENRVAGIAISHKTA